MTSNCGASDLEKSSIGFGAFSEDNRGEDAIKRSFTPEFRNRLDAVINFGHLSQEIVMQVVQKFIVKLENQLAERDVQISISDDAARWLAVKGYDKLMGARPLARIIQEKVKKPLADELLFGKLSKGGSVYVELDKYTNELKMICESKPQLPNRKVLKKNSLDTKNKFKISA